MAEKEAPEELETVTGWSKTAADCPHCGFDCMFEGSLSDEDVECQKCDKPFRIGKVM